MPRGTAAQLEERIRQLMTAKVPLTAATQTGSGQVTDAATAEGFAGLQLIFEGDKEPVSLGFTDGIGH